MLASPVYRSPDAANRRIGSQEDRLDLLVADLITLNAEQGGNASRKRLLELGHTAPFLDQFEAEARARANVSFVRDVNDEPLRSLADAEDDMVAIVASMLPSRSFIEAEVLRRGFDKGHVALKLNRACARAALGFAYDAVGPH